MDDNQKLTTKGMGKTYGESGTVIQNGIISDEEFNRNLTGRTAIMTFDKMRRSDATIHAILQMVKLPIEGLEWSVEPASDDEADIKIAEFIERELKGRKVNWSWFLRQALSYLDFGFSVLEKTFEVTDYEGQTRIGIADIGYRKQKSIYSWETKDGKPGVTQQLIGDTISIPAAKLMIFSNEREGDNYEGISLLRYAYKDWYMKDTLVKVNGMSLEKQGMGIPKVEFEPGLDEAEKARARTIMRQMRANEEAYVEVPKGSIVEFLDMKGNTTKEILPTIQYHDRQIALSVLGQFLMLGQSDASGSRAVSQDHSKLFMLSEEAAVKNVEATIQKQLIEQLCDLNFATLPNGYPKLTHSRLEDDDLTQLADAVQKFSASNMLTPDPDLEQHIRDIVHLPKLPDKIRKRLEIQMDNPEPANTPEPKPKNKADKQLESSVASIVASAEKSRRKLIDILVSQ